MINDALHHNGPLSIEHPLQVNLASFWDRSKICRNPHRGWYVHYFTNSRDRYGASLDPNDNLDDLPGFSHIYLRLPWCDLEPREKDFRWEILDEVLERWEPRGCTFGFRISCKETGPDYPYATPEWVEKAGARGVWCPRSLGHDEYRALDPVTARSIGRDWHNWEPDYGDTVFLAKLEKFHEAFSDRYSRRPSVDYIDIGSYGDWGEGHTWFGSRRKWPFEVIRTHIDLHRRIYPSMIIEGNDRLIRDRTPDDGSGERILSYMIECGLALRDDAPGQMPSYAESFWKTRHVDVETTHYSGLLHNLRKQGKGKPEYDDYLKTQLDATHATYFGFHSYPRTWLEENRGIAWELANRIGYWIFPSLVEFASGRDETVTVTFEWTNEGVAPPYRSYLPQLGLFDGRSGSIQWVNLEGSDSRNWLPGERVRETLSSSERIHIHSGAYQIVLRLLDRASDRIIDLGLTDNIAISRGTFLLPGICAQVSGERVTFLRP